MKIKSCHSFYFLIAFFLSSPLVCARDNYLDAIQSEIGDLNDNASSSTQPPVTPAAESTPIPFYPGVMTSTGEQNMSQQQFERALHSAYPGSFFLLRKLPVDEQKSVYSEYQQSGDLARVRQMVIELARSHR